MLLDDFTGGRNTRVTPSKLLPIEAQVYTNIDNTSGPLTPIKEPLTTGVVIDEWFTYYYGNTEWISRTVDSDFVEYRNTMYISNGGALEEYSAVGSRKVGILGPINVIPLSDINIGATAITITAPTPGTLATIGTFNYRLALYSSVLGKTIYKDYQYTLPTFLSTGYNININITGLSASYFTAGASIKVYRDIGDGVYKEVISTTYTSGMNIVDSVFNISTKTTLPTSYTKDVYNYVYTYYDSTTGRESKPSLPSNDQVNGIGTVVIGAIPISSDLTETSIDTIRVYRIGGLLTQYTLIDELAYPVAATTPYVDTKADIDVVGSHILDSIFNDLPLSGLKYITTSNAMLFGAIGSKLYYSDIAKPYAWPAENFIDIDDTITGIGVLSTGVLVFTKFLTYIIVGNSPNNFSKYLYNGSQGCVSHKSIQFVDNNLIWVSEDGMCTTNGGLVNVVTLPMLGKLSFYQIYSTAVLDNVYYVSYKEGISDYIIAFDFRYNQIVKDIVVTGKHVVAKKDSLYQRYNGILRELFKGENNLTFTYKSGVLTEGKYSTLKVYKDIYIRYSGTINVKVYIDGILNVTKDLTGTTIDNLKLSGVAKGYGIEFEITGTGTVYEIDYNIVGRQDA